MKNGKVIDDPEEEVYRRLKKKANEEIEMMHKEFIRMETDKGCSKEEAEAHLRGRNAHREIKSIAISEM